ncbi:MAG: DUF1810 domain-containing protein [Sphingomicrobium sp.]
MDDPYNLHRFVAAQDPVLDGVIAELRSGAKVGHWMWFVFPQLRSLGRSAAAQYYGIASIDEARAYLAHDLLGPRLRQCIEAVLPWAGKRSPEQIFGPIDTLKLRSCLTLFDAIEPGSIFGAALTGLFDGRADQQTLALLNSER